MEKALRRQPFLTAAFIGLCVIIWLSIHLQIRTTDPVTLLRRFWVFNNPADIWNGAYYGLLAAPFVHIDVLHIFFNMLLFWELGARIEWTLGRQFLFIFTFFAALVTSGAQLFTGGWPCIGASGIVFAFFGLMLGARRKVPLFFSYLTTERSYMFIGWLFLCLLITWFNLMPIGNVAHFSGFAFGLAVSAVFFNRRWLLAGVAGLGALALIAVLSTFWAPFNSHWTYWKYHHALKQQQPAAAQVLLDKAANVRNINLLNEIAWRLATSPTDSERNGAKAVEIAKRACELSHWQEPAIIDTLAAAYAEVGEWDEALQTQQRALDVLRMAFEEDLLTSADYATVYHSLSENLQAIRDHQKIREALPES